MSRFQDKVVVITGSSGGIGRQAALDFAKEGASVTIHGQSTERLQETKKALIEAGSAEGRIHVVQGPIQEEQTQKELVEGTVAKFGRLDVLVNSCGVVKPQELDINNMLDISCYDYVFQVNVRSVVLLTQRAAPHLEKTKGCVVNVSSIVGKLASDFYPFYSMSKAALDHWSMDAAVKYASKGIRVNTVSPGPIKTDFITRHRVQKDKLQQMEESYARTTLMKRYGTPGEVSGLITTLASDTASFVTGATWVVDGGRLVRPPQ